MTPKRLSAKFFFDPTVSLDAADLIPVFHDWIGRRALEEVLIDVADYSHVHNGPALMLVALEADYVLDLAEGKPGLRYIRKRNVPDSLTGAIALTIAQAARACELIRSEKSLEGPIAFDTSMVEIEMLDKLRYPSDLMEDVQLEKALLTVGQEAFAQENVRVARVSGDSRRPRKLVVRGSATAPALIARRLKNGTFLKHLNVTAAH